MAGHKKSDSVKFSIKSLKWLQLAALNTFILGLVYHASLDHFPKHGKIT